MKTLTQLFLAFVLAIFVAQSCEQLDHMEVNTSETPLTYRSRDTLEQCPSGSIESVTFSDSVLVFSSAVHYHNVIYCLDNAVEEHNELVDNLAANSHLEGDELEEYVDHYVDSIGYNDWQPLVDFESEFDEFNPRRVYIEELVVNWLANSDTSNINWDLDPDNRDYLSDVERSLVNENGYVKIGTSIINMVDNASQTGPDCFIYKRKKEFSNYTHNGKKRIKHKYESTIIPYIIPLLAIRTKSVVVHYKRKGIRWVRSRALMSVKNIIETADYDCFDQLPLQKSSGIKYRNKVKASATDWFDDPLQFMHETGYSEAKVYEGYETPYILHQHGLTH